jgi:eukaryotic-like serine/threonine-protein kinase
VHSFINREIGRRYLIRDLRGAGAHARVYRATDSVRGRDVALKLYNPDAMDAQIAEAARNFEVWEGAGVLPLLEVHPEFLEGEVTIMPLMERTLADVNQIFASEAIHYTGRILTGLDFCHGRGVIHGDVKPSNAFVNDRGAVLLGDFGVRDFLPEGLRGHTLEYAAPELLVGEPRSPASDVWATAVTLYELLTDALPFGSRAEQPESAIADAISSGRYRHPDEIRPYLPLQVRNFFRGCFEPDPADRTFRTPDAMRRALPELGIRAEWIQWSKDDYVTYWQGFEVAEGRRTGTEYSASVRERPRLELFEAEVKRASPGGDLRRWPNVAPYQGKKKETIHRMVLWMRNITRTGHP